MNRIKRIITFFTIFALVFVLFGCSPSAADAQAAFENTMDALKSCDKNRIDEFYSFAELSSFVDETAGEDLQNAVISTLAFVEYSVNSATVESNGTVKLNVEIKTVNFSNIMQNYINKVMDLVNSDDYKASVQAMSNEAYRALMAEQMIEAISDENGEKTARTIDVIMVESDGVWKLGGNSDEFLGALFANMSEAVAAII